MRVLCLLREIQERTGLTKAELEQELDMDPRTINKLLEDSDKEPWRLDRDALHRYLLFAHDRGADAFRVEADPIWRTFEKSERVLILRGPGRADVSVEDHLIKYFGRLRARSHTTTSDQGVEEAMRSQNCVFIGSPKANPASEHAFALLWGVEPFDSRAKKRDRIPVHFLGMNAETPSALLRENGKHGLSVQVPGAGERSYLKVDWLPPEEYAPYQGVGQDAAVLAVCHRPLGTQENVTTIVIAGYTGLATLTATKQATFKKIPDLLPAATPGQPCFAVVRFQYKKRRHYRGVSLDDLRAAVEDSATWGPPWDGFFL
jgi:hypothetical protein